MFSTGLEGSPGARMSVTEERKTAAIVAPDPQVVERSSPERHSDLKGLRHRSSERQPTKAKSRTGTDPAVHKPAQTCRDALITSATNPDNP